MHHVKQVHIENFRACRNVTLDVAPVTPVVGYNNAGKSSILDAIAWLLAPHAIRDADVFNACGGAIVVAADIGGLGSVVLGRIADDHKTAIAPFVCDERIWIRRRIDGPGTASQSRLEVKRPSAEGGLSIDDGWSSNPAGIWNAIRGLFPEPIRIRAMEDAAADVGEAKKSNTLGKLLALSFPDSTLDPSGELDRLLGAVSDILAAGDHQRPDGLKRFDEELQNMVRPIFPGLQVTTSLEAPSVHDLLARASLRVRLHGDDPGRDLASLGHGSQRMIQVAMIRRLATASRDTGHSTTLLLFDEPELYLHPRGIEHLRLALAELAEGGYQTLFTTHAPSMLCRDTAPDTVIVSRPSHDAGTSVRLPVRSALDRVGEKHDKHLVTLFQFASAAQVFFSDRVLLTEGPSDATILRAAIELVERDELGGASVGVVRVDGVQSVPPMRKVLDAMSIPSVALVDLDAAWRVFGRELERRGHGELEAEAKAVFKRLSEDGSAHVGRDGWPRKNSDGTLSAEDSWRAFALDDAGARVARSVHEALLEQGVFAWSSGSLEAACGIVDKGYEGTTAFVHDLDEMTREHLRATLPELHQAARFAVRHHAIG